MPVIKCKMCGGNITVEEGKNVIVCDYCDSVQTVPSVDNEKILNLYNRANSLRIKQEFDEAMSIYQMIILESPNDAEAHYCMFLCRYGVTYVDDYNGTKKPTINRMQLRSVFDDQDYKDAIALSDVITKKQYEEEAKKIANIQKKALAISQNESPYDIFICYKETDENGKRTIDSAIAEQIYNALINAGYKVFFSRITLEDKLGTEYEPYIFAALNSSKVMLALGTRPEYFNAVWVKNEWSRFLYLMNEKPGTKYLFPCYRDMAAYDLPVEMASLQAQDLNSFSFIQDLLRGINKIFGKNTKPSQTNTKPSSTPSAQNQSDQYESLIKRIEINLKTGDFYKADTLIDKVLDLNYEDGKAYLYKILVQEKLKKVEDLSLLTHSIKSNKYYDLAYEYGDEEQRKLLKAASDGLTPKEIKYRELMAEFKKCNNLDDYLDILPDLKEIARYKDVNEYIDKINKLYLKSIYDEAMQAKASGDYSTAIEKLVDISFEDIDFLDVKTQLEECQNLHIENQYKKASILASQNKYQEAIQILAKIKQPKAKELTKTYIEAQKKRIYEGAIVLFEKKEFEKALEQFRSISDYYDAQEKIVFCVNSIKEGKYNLALSQIKSKKFIEAELNLKECSGYKDADEILKSITKKAKAERERNTRKREIASTISVTKTCDVMFIIALIVPVILGVVAFFILFDKDVVKESIIESIYQLVILGFSIFSIIHIFIKCYTPEARFGYYKLYGILMIVLIVINIILCTLLQDQLSARSDVLTKDQLEGNGAVLLFYNMIYIYVMFYLIVFLIVNANKKKKYYIG